MTTEIFTVKHEAGKTVFFRFYDPTQDKLFDFNDDTWQAAPTTEALAATEKTAFGDGDESTYIASLDLAALYASAAHKGLLVQSVDDLATDEIIGHTTFFVSNGDLVAPNADQIAEIGTAITIGFPQAVESSAGNVTTGTQTSGTHASTSADDGMYWQIAGAAAAGGFGVNVDQTFSVGTSLKANTLHINANETLVGVVNVWLYDYVSAAYEQVSDPDHTSISGSSDKDYRYIIYPRHQQVSDGEVKVRYTSTDTTTNKYLYLDQVYVNAIAVSALSAQEIAQAVWETNLHNVHGAFVDSAGHILHDTFALATTVGTGDTNLSFTLTAGVATNNAYYDMIIKVEDETDGHAETRRIVTYTSGRVVTVDRAFSFIPAAGDHAEIVGIAYAGTNADISRVNGVDVVISDFRADSGGSGDGPTAVTLTVVDSADTPIPCALVWLLNSTGTQVSNAIATDDDGQIEFNLNVGITYSIYAKRSGYTDIIGEAWTVVDGEGHTSTMESPTSYLTITQQTLAELRGEVRLIIATDSSGFSDSRIDFYLNEGQQHVANVFTFPEMRLEYTGVTVDGTKTYEYPARIKEVRTLRLDTTDFSSVILERLSERIFDNQEPRPENVQEAKPEFYIHHGTFFELHPIPDAEYTLNLRADVYPADLVADGQSSDLQRKDSILVAYAVTMIFAIQKEWKIAAYWATLTDKRILSAIQGSPVGKDYTAIPAGFSLQSQIRGPSHTDPWASTGKSR